jgi:hypothetical protein
VIPNGSVPGKVAYKVGSSHACVAVDIHGASTGTYVAEKGTVVEHINGGLVIQ